MAFFEIEARFLRANREELAAKYPGKYLVIQGETVWGAYETYDEGVDEGTKMLGWEPFLVRSVLDADKPLARFYPMVIHREGEHDRP